MTSRQPGARIADLRRFLKNRHLNMKALPEYMLVARNDLVGVIATHDQTKRRTAISKFDRAFRQFRDSLR